MKWADDGLGTVMLCLAADLTKREKGHQNHLREGKEG